MNINVGENNGRAKLNWKKVQKIRELYDGYGYSQTKLAKRFKVSRPTISYIVNDQTWREESKAKRS